MGLVSLSLSLSLSLSPVEEVAALNI